MPNLLLMLKESEPGVLQAIAETWNVMLKTVAQEDAVPTLQRAMLDSARAESVYDRLTDTERGALQALVSQTNHQMAVAMFERMYGPLSRMGQGRIEKEQPHKTPKTTTDALFYRGLIAQGNTAAKSGEIVPMIYLPEEMIRLLPLHRTSYSTDRLEEDGELPVELSDADIADETEGVETVAEQEVRYMQSADTSLIDDMTTFLAYLRLHTAAVEGDTLLPVDSERLLPFMVKPEVERITFLLCIGVSAELVDVREGRAYTRRDGLQKWFALPRWGQVRLLAEAWRSSTHYIELFHVPTLYPDPLGFEYDAVVARYALIDHITRLAPAREWWGIQSFIDVIRDSDPDFQRVDGDYDSWYLRDANHAYLRGFESWDAVEGGLIGFLITGPMHWLGLMDLGEDVARLNAYGRAFLGLEAFPQPADPDERIILREDNTMIASRKVARADRFTLARIAAWVKNADLFTYRLETRSLEHAMRDQGITASQIEAFLKKHSDPKPVPGAMLRMIQIAQQGPVAQVTLEQVVIVRALSEEIMTQMFDEPQIRRYLGARLGPLACIVLYHATDELGRALETMGIRVEMVS